MVREAIATLAADGLVEARQGAGVFVRRAADARLRLDQRSRSATRSRSAINVLEVRMGIEIESAGLAALRRNSAQEAEIQEAFFEFERLLALGQATGKTDFAFHRAIAAATNNPFYVEVLDALGARTIPCDVTSPWGTDSVLTREYQEGLQREHLVILEGDFGRRSRRRRATPCARISRPARSAIASGCSGQQAEYLCRRRQSPAPSRPTSRIRK